MFYTTKILGGLVRQTRKRQNLTQQDLAMTCGTGVRFISDLENGKPTCELAKTLTVIQTLGIRIELSPPYENQDHEEQK